MAKHRLTIADLDELERLRLRAVEEVLRDGNTRPSFTIDAEFAAVGDYVAALQRNGRALIRQAREAVKT